ncbi:hypothetical protein GY45DRAFT_988824 [Cubamyces sp. BRFM 1775]|nr:hypothetical protein GY45DRAFT_988824 [Cubamyces sp. BRFM 1775]
MECSHCGQCQHMQDESRLYLLPLSRLISPRERGDTKARSLSPSWLVNITQDAIRSGPVSKTYRVEFSRIPSYSSEYSAGSCTFLVATKQQPSDAPPAFYPRPWEFSRCARAEPRRSYFRASSPRAVDRSVRRAYVGISTLAPALGFCARQCIPQRPGGKVIFRGGVWTDRAEHVCLDVHLRIVLSNVVISLVVERTLGLSDLRGLSEYIGPSFSLCLGVLTGSVVAD